MSRYKLKAECAFVDARDYETKQRQPEEVPFAHVIDTSTKKYLKLNDMAGYIARFIFLGVDTVLIPQILRSEFGGDVERHQAEVATVVKMLKGYLVNLRPLVKKPYEAPASLGEGIAERGYTLDFGIHSIGTVNVKLPPCPLPPPPPR